MYDETKLPELLDNLLMKFKKGSEDLLISWEYKTFNIHRGVLYLCPKFSINYSRFAEEVRQKLLSRYKVSWWRGFAFGVVLEVKSIPDDLQTIIDSIDVRNNKKGTWQWVILICHEQKITIAVHTWMAGLLTPVYQEVLKICKSSGYEVKNIKKEKDKVMNFLIKISRLKGLSFKEYEPK